MSGEPITPEARAAVERLLDMPVIAVEDEEAIVSGMIPDHVVVCLGGLSVHVNGSPIFGCLVYGPFTKDEVGEKAKEIQRLEGGAVLIRPLVDLSETYRRISAD